MESGFLDADILWSKIVSPWSVLFRGKKLNAAKPAGVEGLYSKMYNTFEITLMSLIRRASPHLEKDWNQLT